MTKITRRRFLGDSSAAMAGLLLAGAGCAGPVRSTPNPDYQALRGTPAGEPVHLSWVRGESIAQACLRLLPRVTDMSWLRPGDSVFVKVACNSPSPHPAVTSPDAVTALVGYLRHFRPGTIWIGDQAGVEHVRLTADGRVGATRAAMRTNGLLDAVLLSGADLHCFDDQGWDEGYRNVELDFPNHWGDHLWLPRILDEVDHVINLPRLGAHALAGYTCAIKNAVGWLRDDSRLHFHQKGGSFFEQIAEINHAKPLREKLRFSLTLGTAALVTIGPDFGSEFDFDGVLAVGSTALVEHDLVASSLLRWLDTQESSMFDVYSPYPGDVDFWNRNLVGFTWGEQALEEYEQLVAFEGGSGLAYDVCLSHMATLQGRRPEGIAVEFDGMMPEAMEAHLSGVPELNLARKT